MTKKIMQILFWSCFLSLTVNSQTLDKDNSRSEKAKTILKLAQEAIYRDAKIENVKAIQLKSSGTSVMDSTNQIEGESQPRLSSLKQTLEENISIEFDDKISQTTTSFSVDKNPIENFTKVKTTLSGDKFNSNTDTVTDGKRLDWDDLLNSPYIPESVKKQMKEMQENAKKAITKESIQKGVSSRLFPILLDMKLMSDVTFVFIGKAEAGNNKADILEIETNTGRQTRYFFDEKTHLLLMVTDEISKDGKSSKTSTYFSDYQIFDGILVAKKVNTETESSVENMEVEIMGKKQKISTKLKTITETILTEFKINPKFKPETFVVNEVK